MPRAKTKHKEEELANDDLRQDGYFVEVSEQADGSQEESSPKEKEPEEEISSITLHGGSVFGESVVFGLTNTRMASVVAMTTCNLWRADGSEVIRMGHEFPAELEVMMRDQCSVVCLGCSAARESYFFEIMSTRRYFMRFFLGFCTLNGSRLEFDCYCAHLGKANKTQD